MVSNAGADQPDQAARAAAQADQAASAPTQDNEPTAEVASLRDRLMRALAETENTRRQGERREQDARQFAITGFAREMLQVADNLRRAIEAGTAASEGGLLEGVAATDRILTQIFNRFGIEEIDALNKPFDPARHEAVLETDETDLPPGNVAAVLEPGYMLNDRLLRPARVVVAKSRQPSAQPAGQ
jgi:molecular chaperone GrpE